MASLSSLDLVRLVLSLASTGVYAAVGVVVGRRAVSRESLPANRGFQFFWYSLAFLTLFTPLTYLLQDVFSAHFLAYLYILEFLLIVIVAAIGALTYYLLYVYTGRSWVFWPVAGYHLLLLTWLMGLIASLQPYAYDPTNPACNGGLCYHNQSSELSSSALGLSLILPILIATVMYFALIFRVTEPEQRRRIGMVSAALFAWFGSSLLGSIIHGTFQTASGQVQAGPLSQWVYWSYVISPLISLTASIVILLAYASPRRGPESAGG